MTRLRIGKFSALLIATSSAVVSAGAQQASDIWKLPLGTRVADLPDDILVDPACGTNGGPPGLILGGLENFVRCRPEPSGLREVWVRYDDEQEFVARAARDSDAIARSNAMVILGQPVILSLLIDGNGAIQGYRIISDPHAEADVRFNAHQLAFAFKTRFDVDAASCEMMEAAPGETPIAGEFVKERCDKRANGIEVRVESRHYYKPGQSATDQAGLTTVNQFESSARMEVVAIP